MAERSAQRSSVILSLTLGSIIVCLVGLLSLLSYNAFETQNRSQQQIHRELSAVHSAQQSLAQSFDLMNMATAAIASMQLERPISTANSKHFQLLLEPLKKQAHVEQVFLLDAEQKVILPEFSSGASLGDLLPEVYPVYTEDTPLDFQTLPDYGLLVVVNSQVNSGPTQILVQVNFKAFRLAAKSTADQLSDSSPWFLLAAMFALCLVAVSYFSWVLSKSDSASLTTLRQYAAALAAGENYSLIKIEQSEPLKDLALSLQQIAGQLDEQQRRLLRLSYRDSLTGLANRHLFFKWLSDELSRKQQHSQPFALLFIDLDQFKRVNDSLGHEAGDQILLEVAGRLRQLLIEFYQDCAEEELAYLARFSGDEFGILLPKIEGRHDAFLLAKRIQDAMLQPFHSAGHVIQLAASTGICLCPEDGKTPGQLLKNAEMAMYQAKALGPNNFRFFAEFMSISAIKRLNIEVELQRAIEQQELRLFYQPKFDVNNRRMVGSEALLRWQHPQKGLIGPDSFLEIAEQTPLIAQIGRWVTQEVCRQLSVWQGTDLGKLPVALNVSAAEFQLRNVVSDLKENLLRYRLDPQLLQMEVTETTIASHEEKVGMDLAAIRELGVKVWIDDFGTGYSSLGYLRRFSVDGVKIDRSFVKEVAHNNADAALCSAIVAMAHQLHLEVVAEGVEEREQFDLLLASGCAQAQGFFYSRPMSPEVLLKQVGQLLQLSQANLSFNSAEYFI